MEGYDNQSPPTYDELPARLPLLSQPLPLVPSLLESIQRKSVEAEEQLPTLAVSTQQQPADLLALVVGNGTLEFSGQGKHTVVQDTGCVVNRVMMQALRLLGITYQQGGNIADSSGASLNALRPDWLLMLKGVLMFKVRAAAGVQVWGRRIQQSC